MSTASLSSSPSPSSFTVRWVRVRCWVRLALYFAALLFLRLTLMNA